MEHQQPACVVHNLSVIAKVAVAVLAELPGRYQRRRRVFHKVKQIAGAGLAQEPRSLEQRLVDGLEQEKNQIRSKLSEQIASLKDNGVKLESQIALLEKEKVELKNSWLATINENKSLENKLNEMLNSFSELIQQSAFENTLSHYNLGILYIEDKQYRKAIDEFGKCLEFTPDYSDAHFSLGYIYSEFLPDREKAIYHLEKFLTSASGNNENINRAKEYLTTLKMN